MKITVTVNASNLSRQRNKTSEEQQMSREKFKSEIPRCNRFTSGVELARKNKKIL